MKYLIVSDLHGSISSYEALSDIIKKEKPDTVVFLGDMCRNDNYLEINAVLNNVYTPLVMVSGNCDNPYVVSKLNVGFWGTSKQIDEKTQSLFFTHGHVTALPPPTLKKGDVFFYGHRHCTDVYVYHGVYCVCVGSLAYPRCGSNKAYCTFENGIIRLISAENGTIILQIDTKGNN